MSKTKTTPVAALTLDTDPNDPTLIAQAVTDTILKQRIREQTPEQIQKLQEQLCKAQSLDEALKIIRIDAAVPFGQIPYVVSKTAPVPVERRGLLLRVYVAAVRLQRPFTATDIEEALPGPKSIRFIVRKLAKSGHFIEVNTSSKVA